MKDTLMATPPQDRIQKNLLVAVAGGLLAGLVGAQNLQTEFLFASDAPTWVGSPPGDSRVFAVEQIEADIEIYDASGSHLGQLLDLTGKVESGAYPGERGLLSMAFHPDFETNGHIFVYYDDMNDHTRIERYTMTPPSGLAADPLSALTILTVAQPNDFHRGGNLQFGSDNLLYFAFGDGGGTGACDAQKGDVLRGKMIRIDVDTDDFPADPLRNYGIPASNPFVGDPTFLDEIYHLGFRNPWRWGFDPANGDMYIADVGGTLEEISYVPAGASGLNFGWPIKSGSLCIGPGVCPFSVPDCTGHVDPIFDYEHSAPTFPCAVIGGLVYRGNDIPGLDGTYFYSDFCNKTVFTFRYDPTLGVQDFQDRTAELDPPGPLALDNIRTFGYDGDGELLFADDVSVFRVLKVAGLEVDVPTFSISSGGAASLSLTSSTGFGGDLYVLAGSITGTAGISFGSITLPLTLDAYTLYTVNTPNQVPLLNNISTLDGSGASTATFTAGPGLLPLSLVGLNAYHAFAILESGFPVAASNFATIELLP